MPKKSDYLLGRREFVGGVVGLIGALISAVVGLPAVGYLISPALKGASQEEWIPLGPRSALKAGVPTPFTYSQMRQVAWRRTRISHTVYAISDDGQTVTVFSDVCTHLSCKVRWNDERKAFVCPCHDGIFDKDGNVVSGPPPRPLDRFEAKVENDQLTIRVEA